jgi:hypothetical protein
MTVIFPNIGKVEIAAKREKGLLHFSLAPLPLFKK